MKKDEFFKVISQEWYLILKGVRPSAYIYPVTKKNVKDLSESYYCKNDGLRYWHDPYDYDKLWIYKNESIGNLIELQYLLPYIAKQSLMGILLGYSPDNTDEFLNRVSYSALDERRIYETARKDFIDNYVDDSLFMGAVRDNQI